MSLLDPIDHHIIRIGFMTIVIMSLAFVIYFISGAYRIRFYYVDLDGNEGYANYCEDEGVLKCDIGDGANYNWIQVKEFRTDD